ncbi:hypothetical protein GXW82_43220 [Streptacidiphilus sp. 4-A2]|nr:hypothetical protein [Streptacidiphilus sp. 4-A2]
MPTSHDLASLRAEFSELPPDTARGVRAVVSGRVVAQRAHRRLSFAVIRQGTAELQLMMAEGALAGSSWQQWRELVDIGDHVMAEGEVITTRTGELSLAVTSWSMLGKSHSAALRTGPGRPPGSHPRYLEMVADPAKIQLVRDRASTTRALREALFAMDYEEMETPLLQAAVSGGSRPFSTWMNAWGSELYLRATSELYLKRLVAGGMDRIFEINRAFRNEGVDARHFPEFTLLEAYTANTDYTHGALLAESLVREVFAAVTEPGAGDSLPEFQRATFVDLLAAHCSLDIDPDSPWRDLRVKATAEGYPDAADVDDETFAMNLFREVVQPTLRRPTFVFDFPEKAAIMARRSRLRSHAVECWSLFIAGLDVGQGCTELTDPMEQRERFLRQQGRSDIPAETPRPTFDEEFLGALYCGLPPLGGLSLGIERLLMAVKGVQSLRDCQSHPISRPRRGPRASGWAPSCDDHAP